MLSEVSVDRHSKVSYMPSDVSVDRHSKVEIDTCDSLSIDIDQVSVNACCRPLFPRILFFLPEISKYKKSVINENKIKFETY